MKKMEKGDNVKLTIYCYCLGLVLLLLSAPMIGNAANILIVRGSVTDADDEPLDGLDITATNVTKDLALTQVTGNSGAGTYAITFLDFFGGSVADIGDAITVSVRQEGKVVGETTYMVDGDAFDDTAQTAEVNIDIQLGIQMVSQLSVTSIIPDNALASGGATVQIIGEGFQEGVSVTVGGSTATDVEVVSDTEISVPVPPGARGVVEVVATNPDGGSGSIQFSYLDYPPWDVDKNGTVNILDLVLVANHFGEAGQGVTGDIDKNGTVNILDLVLVANHFGEKAEASVSD